MNKKSKKQNQMEKRISLEIKITMIILFSFKSYKSKKVSKDTNKIYKNKNLINNCRII